MVRSEKTTIAAKASSVRHRLSKPDSRFELCNTSGHSFDGCDKEPRFRGSNCCFPVLDATMALVEPCENAIDWNCVGKLKIFPDVEVELDDEATTVHEGI